MTLKSVLNRLSRLAFEAEQSWDESYQLKINRQFSGLPHRLAVELTQALNEAVTRVRLKLKQEIDHDAGQTALDLGRPDTVSVHLDRGDSLSSSGSGHLVGNTGIDPRD